MKQAFYKRVGILQRRLKSCISLKEMRQIVQSLDIDLFVSYNTNAFFAFTENLKDNCLSGSLSFAIYTKISDGNHEAMGRPTTFHMSAPSFSKEELEKVYVKTILRTLEYLNFEENETINRD